MNALLLQETEVEITNVEYAQTLLINGGGINWEWIHAVTVYPNGDAEIIWEDRWHRYEVRGFVPGVVTCAKRMDWFNICDKYGWSGYGKERTHISIGGVGHFRNITKESVPGYCCPVEDLVVVSDITY